MRTAAATKWIVALTALLLMSAAAGAQGLGIERLNEEGEPIEVTAPAAADIVPGEVIVKFAPGVLDAERLAEPARSFDLATASPVANSRLAAGLRGLEVDRMRRAVRKLRPQHQLSRARNGGEVRIPDLYNLMVLEVPEKTDIERLIGELRELEGIEYAEPNVIMYPNDLPNDDYYPLQDGFAMIDADSAWDVQVGSYGAKVAVVDTGIDYHNPDLGNGDFGVDGAKVRGGWDYFNNDGNPDDDGTSSHGTSCAGIIGAVRNNATGVAGLAGGDHAAGNIGVQLFAFKVGGATGGFPTDKVIDALTEAAVWTPTYGYGVHVINFSAGNYSYLESFRNAVRVVADNNVVLAAAKGNDDTTNHHYPSDYDSSWILSVGASDLFDDRASFSNYGNGMDVIAPGTSSIVYTTRRVEAGTYGSFSGTSAAAPHVAGLAALIRSENVNLHQQDVEGLIRAAADSVPAMAGQDYTTEHGDGRINAGKALEMMRSPWQLDQLTATGGSIVSSTGFLTITFFNTGGGLASGTYYPKRHEVRKTVSITGFDEFHVWCRGINATVGWSAANPNYQEGYCSVVDQTATSATLRTWIYQVYDVLGRFVGWYPTTASGVVFAYTVAGLPPPPLSVSITGPASLGYQQAATWSASVTGGSGAGPTYEWRYRYNGQGQYSAVVSTSSSYTRTMGTTDFELLVEVTRGAETQFATHYVDYSGGGGGGGGGCLTVPGSGKDGEKRVVIICE